MRLALGLTVALAAFALTSALASLAVLVAWRGLGSRLARVSPARQAAIALGLRLLPSAAALAVSIFLVAPAWLSLEPEATGESPGIVLVSLAVAGLALLATGLGRGILALRATRQLLGDWLPAAKPLVLAASPAPAYRIRDSFPAVCVVGILRPRLFVAEKVLDHLSAGEMEAVLAHEAGHLRARDNLKGLLVRSCVDGLAATGLGRGLERAWREAAESLADAQAASKAATQALDLATALIKVARLAPSAARVELPAPALHTGGDFASRVEALVVKAHGMARGGAGATGRAARVPAAAVLVTVAAVLAAGLPSVLPLVHIVIEALVRGLP
jgi:Zn-dependent protease with chaperone function